MEAISQFQTTVDNARPLQILQWAAHTRERALANRLGVPVGHPAVGEAAQYVQAAARRLWNPLKALAALKGDRAATRRALDLRRLPRGASTVDEALRQRELRRETRLARDPLDGSLHAVDQRRRERERISALRRIERASITVPIIDSNTLLGRAVSYVGPNHGVSLQIDRLEVNYLRHELSPYDQLLHEAEKYAPSLREVVRKSLQQRVYTEIARAYPYLTRECVRQAAERGVRLQLSVAGPSEGGLGIATQSEAERGALAQGQQGLINERPASSPA